MRALTITLVAALLVFLLAQQLTADSTRWNRPATGGASQVVVSGLVGCFLEGELSTVFVGVEAGLGVIPYARFDHSNLGRAVDLSEACSDLIPRVAEQVPDRICQIGNAPEARDPFIEAFSFVCTGRDDRVISAVGRMARTVAMLGQP
jgi:hypothetical protein